VQTAATVTLQLLVSTPAQRLRVTPAQYSSTTPLCWKLLRFFYLEENRTMGDKEPLDAEFIETEMGDARLALTSATMPSTLIILPLYDRPFFPAQAFPVLMDEEPWLDSVKQIGDTDHHMAGLVMVRDDSKLANLSAADLFDIGSAVRMHHPGHASGKIQFIAEGVQRFRITKWLSDTPPFVAQVEYPAEEKPAKPDEVKAYAVAIINTIKDLLPLNPLYSEELKYFLNRFGPNDPSPLADFAASMTTANRLQLQEVLETFPVVKRMKKVLVLLKKELEVAKLQSQIRQRVEERMSEQQRKFFLREQLKEIQKELGLEKDDRTADSERFKKRLEELVLTEQAQQRVTDELDKLAVLESGSPEYAVTRNYLDWITALPWGKCSSDKLDLNAHARSSTAITTASTM